jgi:L-alanine-DL-glutamate epimerase-like enolase superfamily enzyme
MKLIYHTPELHLRHTFTISRGSMDVQPTLIVELEQGGYHGYGEATSNTFYGVTIEGMIEALESVRPQIERTELEDPVELWDQLHQQLGDQPFAHCALDQAAHDLWGKLRGQPVYRLWGLQLKNLPLTNYTIGLDRIDVMIAKLQERPDWPVFKIKLGSQQDDLEIIRQLRQHTSAVFRVDANCGWTADQTIEYSRQLKQWNVEFIEQPLPVEQWEAMRRVRAESALPVIADESCQVPSDVARCQGAFDGVNIKLVKCGGLTPARRMIDQARQLGLHVMVGCMTESSVGISAIAQLLPLLDYVDMDGALLLREDIARGVTIEQGACRYPQENGCGVQLLPTGGEIRGQIR